MATEALLRSIEARLRLQDELLSHLFLIAYDNDMAGLVSFLDREEAALAEHHGPRDESHPEKSAELKAAIRSHLQAWGNRTIATLHTMQTVRQARATGKD